ncbi:MAG: nicotinate phosphoribosyltransferase [Thermodesulfobacteriota bacterium]
MSTHMELLTDFYELSMAAVYFQEGMYEPATFSLFIRDYPPNRAYFISAGLEEVLSYLETFRFTRDDLDYLDSTGLFSSDFLHYLHSLQFTGLVRAIPEGRLFFKDEPILEVTAPIIQAQIIESFVINTINLQVLLATKASRCVYAAKGRGLIDFSLRRTQGPDAGLRMARSGYLAGMNGTSNVLAGKMYGIPVSGTMAHSFVTSFLDELEAFRAFARVFPQNTVLLIDTYDTLSGAEKAVRIAREMEEQGLQLSGVRLDSGDMLQLSRQVRDLFNREGLDYIRIFASGGFDEYKIQEMDRQGAMIDAFGVGTKVGVSADAPYTDIAYKLVKYAGHPVLKLSSGKKTLVDEKQVFRTEDNERPVQDTIALGWENLDGEPLLKTVMESGKRNLQPDSLEDIRERCQHELSRLDQRFKALESPDAYPVELSFELVKLQAEVVHKVREKELGES